MLFRESETDNCDFWLWLDDKDDRGVRSWKRRNTLNERQSENCIYSSHLFFANDLRYTVTSSENLLLSSRLITMACVLAWPDLLLDLSFESVSLLSSSRYPSLPAFSCFEDVEDTTISLAFLFKSGPSLFLDESCASFLPSPFFSMHARHRFSPWGLFPEQA